MEVLLDHTDITPVPLPGDAVPAPQPVYHRLGSTERFQYDEECRRQRALRRAESQDKRVTRNCTFAPMTTNYGGAERAPVVSRLTNPSPLRELKRQQLCDDLRRRDEHDLTFRPRTNRSPEPSAHLSGARPFDHLPAHERLAATAEYERQKRAAAAADRTAREARRSSALFRPRTNATSQAIVDAAAAIAAEERALEARAMAEEQRHATTAEHVAAQLRDGGSPHLSRASSIPDVTDRSTTHAVESRVPAVVDRITKRHEAAVRKREERAEALRERPSFQPSIDPVSAAVVHRARSSEHAASRSQSRDASFAHSSVPGHALRAQDPNAPFVRQHDHGVAARKTAMARVRAEVEQEQRGECTFRPHVDPMSAAMVARGAGGVTERDFLRRQAEHDALREDHQRRLEQAAWASSPQPRRSVATPSATGAHLQRMQERREQREAEREARLRRQQKEECPFAPRISKHSARMATKRSASADGARGPPQDVVQRLLDDALMRQEKDRHKGHSDSEPEITVVLDTSTARPQTPRGRAPLCDSSAVFASGLRGANDSAMSVGRASTDGGHRSTPDTFNRFLQKQRNHEAKKHFQRTKASEAQAVAEMEDCTFRPFTRDAPTPERRSRSVDGVRGVHNHRMRRELAERQRKEAEEHAARSTRGKPCNGPSYTVVTPFKRDLARRRGDRRACSPEGLGSSSLHTSGYVKVPLKAFALSSSGDLQKVGAAAKSVRLPVSQSEPSPQRRPSPASRRPAPKALAPPSDTVGAIPSLHDESISSVHADPSNMSQAKSTSTMDAIKRHLRADLGRHRPAHRAT